MHYSHRQSLTISISVCVDVSSGAIFSDIFLVILLTVSLLHNVAFNAGTFYLALYYQVCGERPLINTLGYISNFRLSMRRSRIFAQELCSFHTP